MCCLKFHACHGLCTGNISVQCKYYDLSVVQRCIIYNILHGINSKLYARVIQLCVIIIRLMERVQAEEGGWREAGAAFVGCVTRLLERLLDYRSVLQGEENRDKRMACTVNLLVCILLL